MIAHQNMRTRIPHRRAERIRESAHTSKTRTKIKHDRTKTSEPNSRLGTRAKSIRAYDSEETTRALKPGHTPAKSASGRVPHPPSAVLRSFYGQMLGQSGQASRPKHRLEAGPEAQKQKIAPDCNFFAIRDCRDFLNRGLRPKMQQKWLYDGSFPLCRSDGESLIAKKLQKSSVFCF